MDAMSLSLRASRMALVSLVSFGAIIGVGEGEASAQKKPKAAPTGAPAATAPATTPTSTSTPPPESTAEAPPEKKELDTSVETAKAIYFSGDVGFTRSDLGALSNNTGLDRTAANGLLYGLSAGIRLHDLRFGLRWRVYDTTESSLWSFALSAGYALSLRPVTPIFSAHVGYIWDQSLQPGLFRGSLPPGALLPPDVDVKGLLAGLDVNLSYWVTQFLRLGVFAGADLMFLNREQAKLPQSIFGIPQEYSRLPLYSDSGSGVGLNINVGLRGAFDIGIQ